MCVKGMATVDLNLILDALPALVWTTYPDGRLDFINQGWIDYTGLGVDCTAWYAAAHPEDLPSIIERWRAILASGTHGTLEARIRRRDGLYRDFAIRVSPVRGEAGRVVRWCLLGCGVDDSSQLDESLRRRWRDFQSIVDSIPVPVAVTTPTGEVETLNRLTVEYFGRSLDDLKEWKSSDVVHPDDLEKTIAAQAKAHQEGREYDVESRHRRADGIYRWYNVRGFPLRDSQDHIWCWFHLLIDIDDLKRAEVAFAASERQLQLIVDTIPSMAWSARPDGTVDFFNRNYLDYLGLTSEQVQRAGWTSALHPDDVCGLSCTWQEILAEGRFGEAEARLRRHDGVYRWFLFRANPLRDEFGHIVKWYGTNTDIDDLKRVEAELRRGEAFLAQAQKLTRTGSLCWTPSTGELYMSEEIFRIMEYPRTIRPSVAMIRERCHPGDLAFVQDQVDRAARDGCDADITHRLLMPDGSCKYIHVVAQNIGVDPAEPEYVGAVTDVTEQKRAADALERSEAFLAEGQRLARMGNFSWQPSTGEIVWSEPLYRIFELRPDIVVTLDLVASRLHPDDVPLFEDMIERARRGENDLEYQHRIRAADRSTKYLHLTAHRVRGLAGDTRYVGAVMDITLQRIAEEALSKARDQLAHVTKVSSLGALTASMAHEVNQPLSGIITNSSVCLRMLAACPPNVDGAQEVARRIIRDGNRAADVIMRLRALFSRRAMTFGPVDINEAAREVIAMLRGDLDQARVVLRAEFADQLPLAEGDRIQLQQVMMNLVRNAVDAMSDIHGRLRLLMIQTYCEPDEHICLSVRDVGAGLPAEDAKKVFDAFYTTKCDGMGIGLSISHSIIESHHGRLWATSNDGPGMTFAFSIPTCSRIGEAAEAI